MKFDRYILIGILCLLPYVCVGAFLTAPSLVNVFSWVFLSLAVTAADVVCFDMLLANRRKNWCLLLPFTVLFLYAQIVFRWNVLIPFFVTGQFALGIYTTTERAETLGKLKAAKPLLVAGVVGVLLTCVVILTGVGA